MTLSARTELSHSYSFDSKIDAIFKITLVAERRTEAKGFHHIIVLDTSKSMDGQKIELAKNGAQEYVKSIPSGNVVSVVLFSSSVQAYPETRLSEVLPKIRASGLTALYAALQSAFEIAQKSRLPGWILEPLMSRFSTTRDPQLRSMRWKQLRRSGAKFRFPPGSTDDSSTSKLPTLTLSMTRGRPSMPRLKSDWRKMTSSSRKESTTTSSQNSHTTKDSKNTTSTLPQAN